MSTMPMHPAWRQAPRRVKVYKLPAGTRFIDRDGRVGTLLGPDESTASRFRVSIDGRGTGYISRELAVAPIEDAP